MTKRYELKRYGKLVFSSKHASDVRFKMNEIAKNEALNEADRRAIMRSFRHGTVYTSK